MDIFLSEMRLFDPFFVYLHLIPAHAPSGVNASSPDSGRMQQCLATVHKRWRVRAMERGTTTEQTTTDDAMA